MGRSYLHLFHTLILIYILKISYTIPLFYFTENIYNASINSRSESEVPQSSSELIWCLGTLIQTQLHNKLGDGIISLNCFERVRESDVTESDVSVRQLVQEIVNLTTKYSSRKKFIRKKTQ